MMVEVLSSVEALDPEALPLPDPKSVAHSGSPTSRFPVEWRPIPGTMYEASCLGMVRNAKSKRILTPSADRDGYLCVTLQQDGRQRFAYVHRLVLLAFAGPPPSPQHQGSHRDGSRQHNAAWNLRWATPKQNCADRTLHKTVRALHANHATASRRSRIRMPVRSYPGFGDARRHAAYSHR